MISEGSEEPISHVYTVYTLSFSEATCGDIIERATSTIDYDQRDEKQAPGPGVSQVCPVLRDLYKADISHSETCIFYQRLGWKMFVLYAPQSHIIFDV